MKASTQAALFACGIDIGGSSENSYGSGQSVRRLAYGQDDPWFMRDVQAGMYGPAYANRYGTYNPYLGGGPGAGNPSGPPAGPPVIQDPGGDGGGSEPGQGGGPGNGPPPAYMMSGGQGVNRSPGGGMWGLPYNEGPAPTDRYAQYGVGSFFPPDMYEGYQGAGGGTAKNMGGAQMGAMTPPGSGGPNIFNFRTHSFGSAQEAQDFLQRSGINEGFAAMQAKRRQQQAARGTTNNPYTQQSNATYEQGPSVVQNPDGTFRINTDQGSHNWSGAALLNAVQQFGDPEYQEQLQYRTNPGALTGQGQQPQAQGGLPGMGQSQAQPEFDPSVPSAGYHPDWGTYGQDWVMTDRGYPVDMEGNLLQGGATPEMFGGTTDVGVGGAGGVYRYTPNYAAAQAAPPPTGGSKEIPGGAKAVGGGATQAALPPRPTINTGGNRPPIATGTGPRQGAQPPGPAPTAPTDPTVNPGWDPNAPGVSPTGIGTPEYPRNPQTLGPRPQTPVTINPGGGPGGSPPGSRGPGVGPPIAPPTNPQGPGGRPPGAGYGPGTAILPDGSVIRGWNQGGSEGNTQISSSILFDQFNRVLNSGGELDPRVKNAIMQEGMNAANSSFAGAGGQIQRRAAATGNSAGVTAGLASLGRARSGALSSMARQNTIDFEAEAERRRQGARAGMAGLYGGEAARSAGLMGLRGTAYQRPTGYDDRYNRSERNNEFHAGLSI